MFARDRESPHLSTMFHDWTTFIQAFIAGLVSFSLVDHLFRKIIAGKTEQKHWERTHVATSLIHAIVTSVLCVSSCLDEPAMCTSDIISTFTPKAYAFISFELGYFLYDSIDMLRNSKGRHMRELLLHHVIIFVCFGIAVYQGKYIGYAVLSLFLEVNSIFLHLRKLFLLWNRSTQETIYRMNTWLNFATFICFRFGVILLMNIWLLNNLWSVPVRFVIVGQSGLLLMTIINCTLFYRMFRVDVFARRSGKQRIH